MVAILVGWNIYVITLWDAGEIGTFPMLLLVSGVLWLFGLNVYRVILWIYDGLKSK